MVLPSAFADTFRHSQPLLCYTNIKFLFRTCYVMPLDTTDLHTRTVVLFARQFI